MATIAWTIDDALALRIAVALAKSRGVAVPPNPTVQMAVDYIKGYVEEEIGRVTLDVEAREAVRAIWNDAADPLHNPKWADRRPGPPGR